MANNGGGGMSILGVLVGALIVIGLVMFFMGGFGGKPTGGGATSVTVNTPAAPAAPAAPAPAPAPAAPKP